MKTQYIHDELLQLEKHLQRELSSAQEERSEKERAIVSLTKKEDDLNSRLSQVGAMLKQEIVQ